METQGSSSTQHITVSVPGTMSLAIGKGTQGTDVLAYHIDVSTIDGASIYEFFRRELLRQCHAHRRASNPSHAVHISFSDLTTPRSRGVNVEAIRASAKAEIAERIKNGATVEDLRALLGI
jgi:hypothetical protein